MADEAQQKDGERRSGVFGWLSWKRLQRRQAELVRGNRVERRPVAGDPSLPDYLKFRTRAEPNEKS